MPDSTAPTASRSDPSRAYDVVGILEPLIVGDAGQPLFVCPDDGVLVLDTDLHDASHKQAEPELLRAALPTPRPAPNKATSLLVPCRCPDPDEPAPTYWHCSVHDRSNPPRGPVLHGESPERPVPGPVD